MVDASAQISIQIDNCQVYCLQLVDAMSAGEADLLVEQISFLDLTLSESGTMDLASFLCLVYGFDSTSLTRQIVGQVAGFVDMVWQEKGFSQNAMEVSEDEAPLPKHARRDRALVDQLAFG